MENIDIIGLANELRVTIILVPGWDAKEELSPKHLVEMLRKIRDEEIVGTKAHRWLGWVQGAMVASGRWDLDWMKHITTRYKKPPALSFEEALDQANHKSSNEESHKSTFGEGSLWVGKTLVQLDEFCNQESDDSILKPVPTAYVDNLVNGNNQITISVYVDTGVIYDYTVIGHASAREHVSAIVRDGYRRVEGNTLTHFPPQRILKVKAVGGDISTMFPDTVRGT